MLLRRPGVAKRRGAGCGRNHRLRPGDFRHARADPGTYQIYLNYYGGAGDEDLTVARVTVITHENTADEKQQSFSVPLRNAGELVLAHSFVYP